MGFLPVFFPPEPGLAQHRVAALPLPIHRPQLVALRDEDGPDPLHDPAATPALEPVMDGALGAELAGQLVPLAARAQAEDNAVERPAPVGVVPATGLGGPEFLEQREKALPEGVGDFPDRPQGLAFGGFLAFAF